VILMRQSMRLGRIGGIPIGVHWSVFVIMLLLVQGLAMAILPAGARGYPGMVYWGVAVLVAALFLAGLLAHELAHALVARRFGVRVRAITLWLLGGVSEMDGPAPHARGDLLIALAGPLTSLAGAGVFGVAAILAAVGHAGSLAVTALVWLTVMNALLAVFNLLPGAPLDGGRVLAAVLWWIRGDRAAARRSAARAGMVLGTVMMALGFIEILLAANLGGLWFVALGWFLTAAARAEFADAALDGTLTGVHVGDVMSAPAVCGYASQTIADFLATVARVQPYRIFPVLDLDGRLVGLVSLTTLARVPADQRDTVRLARVAQPVAGQGPLSPSTPLVDAAPGLLAAGRRLAPVIDGGHVCGVITAGDVARAMQLAALHVIPARGDCTSQFLTGTDGDNDWIESTLRRPSWHTR
jgi:Zn-dependent protease/predicted transcriptional regulator